MEDYEFSTIPAQLRVITRDELEGQAALLSTDVSKAERLGLLRAEILRRDREYAETKEQERRRFEIEMLNARAEQDDKNRQFQQALADKQMAHATSLAQDQQKTARSAARAATWAAIATGFAAAGAIAQAFIAWWF